MASTIARYEEGVERSPDSFEISQLLEKFAPEPLDEGQSGSGKRPAEYQLTPGASATRAPRLDRPLSDTNSVPSPSTYGRSTPADLPFELQPAPNWSASPEQWNEQYQRMMQFLQTYSGPHIGNAVPAMGASGSQSMLRTVGMNPAQQPNDSAQQFMQLVDWNSSLQNLQASLNPAPPSDPAQFLDPALAGITNDGAAHSNIDPQLGNGPPQP